MLKTFFESISGSVHRCVHSYLITFYKFILYLYKLVVIVKKTLYRMTNDVFY